MKQLCYVALDMGGGVKSCDICFPYIIVLLANGTVGLLTLNDSNGSISLDLNWPNILKVLN